MAHIVCPYCLEKQAFAKSNTCEGCKTTVPQAFIDSAKHSPPVWLLAIGGPEHGKSTYLEGLVVTLEHLHQIAPDAVADFPDVSKLNEIRTMRLHVQKGV